MLITGIDIGLKGGICTMNEKCEVLYCSPMPTCDDGVDWKRIKTMVMPLPDYAVIEDVHAMPKQGIVSTGHFMEQKGFWRGMFHQAGVPLHLVSPQVWKRHFSLIKKDKQVSCARATALSGMTFIPEHCRVPHDGMAEAYLIARWYVEVNKLNLKRV